MNDIYITAKLSIDYIKVKTGMPSDVDEGLNMPEKRTTMKSFLF